MASLVTIDPATVDLTPAGLDDLPRLARLYVELAEAHGDPITETGAAAKLGKGLVAGQKARLFTSGAEVLGFIIWADLGDHVFIRNFLISRAHRGYGLGTALFARFRREILPEDMPIRLEVSADHARRFWAAQGLIAWSTGMCLDPAKEPL